MMLELGCFLGAALVLMLPGVLLAGWLKLGRTPTDRLGLAAACYLASLISHYDLRWFYPLWGIFSLICLAGFVASLRGRQSLDRSFSSIETWVVVVLLLVGVSRFTILLPQEFPRGWDPAFHMILAEKIRLTHHAIFDWSPFESVPLNYPTGMHVLIVVISSLSRLPLSTVFNDLIGLTGILTTAEIYVLSRHFTGDAEAALFAAVAYGFWAIDGSLGYSLWGGLPNELAMLFFIGVLAIWTESSPAAGRIAAIALLYAAVILVHHHVMIASAAVLAVCLLGSIVLRAAGTSKVLVISLLLAALLDAFFLIPYAARAASISSTHIFQSGDAIIEPLTIPWDRLGFLFFVASLGGLVLAALRRIKLDYRLYCGLATLLILFIAGDYILPPLFQISGHPESAVFTASRFLADASYFLATAAGALVAYFRRRFKMSIGAMTLVSLLLGVTLWGTWEDLASPAEVPDSFVGACRWIKDNTPQGVIVFNEQPWTTYLTWRRTIVTPLPISEPIKNRFALYLHLRDVLTGQAPPDPNLLIVQIVPSGDYHDRTILWKGDSGLTVLRLWPK